MGISEDIEIAVSFGACILYIASSWFAVHYCAIIWDDDFFVAGADNASLDFI